MQDILKLQKKFPHSKKQLLLFISIIFLIIFGFLFYKMKSSINHLSENSEGGHVVINGKVINVEIMDEYDEYVKGLSDKEELADDTGFLFDFPDKQIRRFWMKNMHFPIDIIWIEDNQVVGIAKNCPPEGEIPSKHYISPIPVNFVLEVNSGFTDEYKISEGSPVEFRY